MTGQVKCLQTFRIFFFNLIFYPFLEYLYNFAGKSQFLLKFAFKCVPGTKFHVYNYFLKIISKFLEKLRNFEWKTWIAVCKSMRMLKETSLQRIAKISRFGTFCYNKDGSDGFEKQECPIVRMAFECSIF